MAFDRDPFLFPAFLFGGRKDTRKAWRKVLSTALSQGNWNIETLLPSACVPLGDPPAPILLEDDKAECAGPCWYLSWIAYTMAFGPPNRNQAVRPLALAGLKHLWFTIGMLGKNLLFGPLPEADHREYYIAQLRGIVNWIPEILSLQAFYRDSTPGRMNLPSSPGATTWQPHVYVLATKAFPERFKDDPVRWEYQYMAASLSDKHRQGLELWGKKKLGIDYQRTDLIECLLRRGIISPTGDRYELIATPPLSPHDPWSEHEDIN